MRASIASNSRTIRSAIVSYRCDLLAIVGPDSYEINVSLHPAVSPRNVRWRQKRSLRREFAADIGDLRYWTATKHLENLHRLLYEYYHREKYGRRTHVESSRPYQPDGPWHWIPPEGPYDWRERATARFPNPQRPKGSLPDILLLSSLSYRLHGPIELTVEYDG
jgi:hypothetical protein